ncbi:ribosomal protein S18-alanine N-acetyltransferase [Acidiferrobacter sp.]|uniref:ribosomal protein S18-alanine N-acetyltransferase n=1 Tax=Acidiferrobacter sp. TaxID=1872107 RepID=UPI0026214E59|nr:ribosomal protein S18-alanine N-acetyltransferase [Acidiferrobacter sp.]
MSSWRLPAQAARAASSQIRLRAMVREDLPFVMQVERQAYEFPWTEGIFRDCLRVGYCCRVLEDEGRLVGHGIMAVAAGECHLLNICVHPRYRRRGLGRRLLSHLLDVARQGQAKVALLEVRRSNKAAYALYYSLGFNEIGLRKNYYPARHGREDALVLACDL